MSDATASCIGKERFVDPQHARKAARRRPGRDAYRCEDCGGWHVGSVNTLKNRLIRFHKKARGSR